MTDRVKRLTERVKTEKTPICTKKFAIASEILKKNRDESPFNKRALVLEAFLKEMPVFILEDQLIVGDGASLPYGVELCYEYGMWTAEELESMHTDCASWCWLPDESYEFCKNYIADPDKVISRSLPSRNAEYIWKYEELAAVQTSGLYGWPSREKGVRQSLYGTSSLGLWPNVSLAIPLYERILGKGARWVIDFCRERIASERYDEPDSLERVDFWEGVIRIYEAWIGYAHRYSALAEETAAKEADPRRKKELIEISEICRRVPEYPARTFREAVQAFWFTWIMMETPTDAAGRFDQYMYPYYKADLEAGRITYDEALELLELLKVKSQACRTVRGTMMRDASSGGANWFNYTIGGTDRDGNDATNDLTYMLIEASRETMLPNHTLSLRVHEKTPEKLLQKAIELVRTGIGMPAFLGEKEYIEFFVRHGATVEEARDFAISGCLDGNLPGKTRISGGSFIGNMQILDMYLHRGVSWFSGKRAGIDCGDVRECATWEEFMEGFRKEHRYLTAASGTINNIGVLVNRRYNQDPFFSSLMEDCLEQGNDLCGRQRKPYDNLIMTSMCGAINLADALTAIRWWIYDKKKYSMDQLLTALDNDWNGFDEMRRDFLAAPKYGCNDDYADRTAAEYYKLYAEDVEANRHCYGNHIVAGISISMHQMEGKRTPASPEGRKAREILADGSTSPEPGCDNGGPLGVFASAMKIDQAAYNATLLNLKFHPSALRSEEDIRKLAIATKTYLTNGGKHVQYNVVDRETLLAAQAEPDKYRNLIVRVAGYSAYFTQLSRLVQDEVIMRSTFENM